MVTMIKIDGAMVDMEDPCALATALRGVRIKRLSDGMVEESEIRSPIMHQRIKVATTPIALLESEIYRLDEACKRQNGECRVGRRFPLRF